MIKRKRQEGLENVMTSGEFMMVDFKDRWPNAFIAIGEQYIESLPVMRLAEDDDDDDDWADDVIDPIEQWCIDKGIKQLMTTSERTEFILRFFG